MEEEDLNEKNFPEERRKTTYNNIVFKDDLLSSLRKLQEENQKEGDVGMSVFNIEEKQRDIVTEMENEDENSLTKEE